MENARINLECSQQHKKQIQNLAKQHGCSLSVYMVAKALDLPIEEAIRKRGNPNFLRNKPELPDS